MEGARSRRRRGGEDDTDASAALAGVRTGLTAAEGADTDVSQRGGTNHHEDTDALKAKLAKQHSRQKELHSVIEELQKEHRAILSTAADNKAQIEGAEKENTDLQGQLNAAEKVLKMMDFVLNMVDFVLKVMNFVLKMMDFVL